MADVLQTASRYRTQIILGMCALGVIIGSLGPWARIVMESVNGTAGDGQLTLFLGVSAGAFILWESLRFSGSRARYLSMMIAFMLASLVGLNTWMSLSSTIAQGDINASVEWGLQLMTVTAFIGGAIAYVQVKAINREKRRMNSLRREQEISANEAVSETEPRF